MAMRRAGGVAIGTYCTVPLLVSLLAYAAVAFVASFARGHAQSDGQPQWSIAMERQQIQDELSALRDEAQKLRWLIRQYEGTPADTADQQERLTGLLGDTEALRRESAALQQRIANLTAELHRLEELAKQVDEARRTREAVDQQIAAQEAELARLREHEAALQRQIDAQEQVAATPAEDWVGGTGRDALYVECEFGGATLMPQRDVLSLAPDDSEQQRLLSAARAKRLVIFLVRPDAIHVFLTYRRIVEADNATRPGAPIDIGWEPIDAEVTLEYLNVGESHRVRIVRPG
jgi:flagellar motor protein MotB